MYICIYICVYIYIYIYTANSKKVALSLKNLKPLTLSAQVMMGVVIQSLGADNLL